MRIRKNTNGSVPRLANGAGQRFEGDQDCCCSPTACTTCCLRVTFTGVTLFTEGVYEQVDSAYEAHFDEIEGSINGVGFIVCLEQVGDDWVGQNYIPVAVKTHVEDVGGGTPYGYACGYMRIEVVIDSAGKMIVGLGSEWGAVEQQLQLFYSEQPIGADALAYQSLPGCPSEYPESGVTFSNESEPELYFGNGDGSVLVEIVPTCNGENPVYTGPDCETAELFGQTICDEDDCPCGRTSEQPTCLLVTIKGSDGIDSVYQGGTLVSGAGGRNYVFGGPYERIDGTWWRFVAVVDDPDVATFGDDAAYFEKQCPGDHLDSYSGTYTYSDPADWATSPGDAQSALTNQTALTGIGTTVTVAACSCVDAADDYAADILCGDGDPPDGAIALTFSRVTDCHWEANNGTYTATLDWDSGTWSLVVTRISDSVEVFSATWSGTGDDPTGSHPFDSSIWDEDPCTAEPGSLRVEIE